MEKGLSKFCKNRLIALFAAVLCLNAIGDDNAKTPAASKTVAIVYPDVRAPFSRIFEDIIQGIQQELPDKTHKIILPKNTDKIALNKELSSNSFDSIILLGSNALKLAKTIHHNKEIVSGATLATPRICPSNISCISMLPSPEKMFGLLKTNSPKTQHIHVIYNSPADDWLISQAQVAAESLNIQLTASPTENTKAHAKLLKKTVDRIGPTDALWLLQRDRVIRDRGVFSNVLESAWKNEFVIFSSNPAHVRKGVLFAFYPNNIDLGITLGQEVISRRNGNEPIVKPLGDLSIAINTRTADHLRLNLQKTDREQFDLIFPSK